MFCFVFVLERGEEDEVVGLERLVYKTISAAGFMVHFENRTCCKKVSSFYERKCF